MVMVTFATPVMFGWCFTVKVRALPVPPIEVSMSAGKIRFGLSLVAVIRAPVVALLTNEPAPVSASAKVSVIAVSVATPGSA